MHNLTVQGEPQQNHKGLAATALITAARTIAVSLIGIVPQLRQSDTRKIEAMQGEITNLKQAMSTMSAPGKRRETGTVPKQDSDVLAPHIRFVWVPVEAEMAEEQLFSKGERALNRGDFTEIEKKENLIYGYDREYIGLIAAIQPTLIMFMIAGPDWQAADRKLEKLKRGF